MVSRQRAHWNFNSPRHLLAAARPTVLEKAVRYSGIVLCFAPVRRAELERIGQRHLPVAELCRVLSIFRQAHTERLKHLDA
jgi:hypothetical protein